MSLELVFSDPNPLITTAVGMTASLFAGTALVALTLPQLSKKVLPKPTETRLADFLPFQEIEEDGKTVKCRNNTICRFIEITGVDQTFLNNDEAKATAKIRKELYDSLADSSPIIRIYTTREKINLNTQNEYPNKFAQEVADKWNKQFETAYRTRTIICIAMKDTQNREKFEEAMTQAESLLDKYAPRVLNQNPENSATKDMTIGKFLGKLVSPVGQPEPKLFGSNLSDVLSSDEVLFMKNGQIRFSNGDDEKYCSVIGMKRLGDDINTQMASELTALHGEITILQTIIPQSKGETILKLKQQQRMVAGSSFSPEIWNQFEEAIYMVDGMDDMRSCLCQFSETIFIYSDNLEELKELEKKTRQILSSYGITSVREKGATQASWFSQFPTYDLKPRVYRLMSSNVAMLANFDRPAPGLPRSDWGPGPIALFNTGANTVHSHQFHISTDQAATGHGLCIAPTGAGKTVLMEFLSCMAARHKNLRHFFFDRYQGTYIYTTMMGGKYLGFNAEKFTQSIRGGMNPFQCEPTDENIEFLKVWLQSISGCNDPDSIDQIGQAIEIAFDTLDKKDRSLANIYDGVFTPGSKLQIELQKWVDPSQYGRMFNAENDCIDLEDNWLTTFDMTKLLDDKLLGGASVSYIMHRIRQTLSSNKAPGFIFIDETEPLLRDENFKTMYKIMLQEFRKLSAVIISVFQRPEALKASGISEVVRQMCSAYYLFPNPGASEKDYEEFELTDREMKFIKGETSPARKSKRSILVKRPMTKESVILDIDLKGPLGPMLKIFSSSSRDVGLASDLQKQFGADWARRYIDHEAP